MLGRAVVGQLIVYRLKYTVQPPWSRVYNKVGCSFYLWQEGLAAPSVGQSPFSEFLFRLPCSGTPPTAVLLSWAQGLLLVHC